MSAWKQFTTKDVTITPFTADKGFTFTGNEIIQEQPAQPYFFLHDLIDVDRQYSDRGNVHLPIQ